MNEFLLRVCPIHTIGFQNVFGNVLKKAVNHPDDNWQIDQGVNNDQTDAGIQQTSVATQDVDRLVNSRANIDWQDVGVEQASLSTEDKRDAGGTDRQLHRLPR